MSSPLSTSAGRAGLVGLALIVGATLWFTLSRKSTIEREGQAASSDQQRNPTIAERQETPPPATARDESRATIADAPVLQPAIVETATERRLSGSVRCSVSDRALAACIGFGQLEFFADPDGRFLVILPTSQVVPLTFRARGYRDLSVPIQPDWIVHDLGVVALEPENEIRVRVIDNSSTPIGGVSVEVPAIDRGVTGTNGPAMQLGKTDTRGLLVVKLGAELPVVAMDADRASPPVLVRPEEKQEVLLVLPSASTRTLGIRDMASRAPLADVGLNLTRLDDFPEVTFGVRTSVDGILEKPVPPGSYRIRLSGGRVVFPPPPAGADRPRGGPGRNDLTDTYATIAAGQPVTWLEVNAQPDRSILLFDAQSGEQLKPASAWLASYEKPPFVKIEGWMDLPGSIQEPDGVISLNHFRVTNSESTRLCASSPGYRPGFIENPAQAVLPGAPPVRLELARSPSKALIIKASDQHAYRRRVFVHETSSGVVAKGAPDLQGRLPTFGWNGGDLALRLGPEPWSLSLREIAAAELINVSELTVIVDSSAQIEVQVPERTTPKLLCAGKGGVRYSGVLRDGFVRFEDLVPGRYEVGPTELLETIPFREAQGKETLELEVASGQTLRVEWETRWNPVDTLSGRVVAQGMDPTTICVVPRFEPLDLPLTIAEGQRRYRISSDGGFEIHSLNATPSRLMFVLVDTYGQWLPIGAGPPAQTIELRCADVTVRVEGEPTGQSVSVTCVPRLEDQRVLEIPIQRSGKVGDSISLGWIPVATPALEVRVGSLRKKIDLRLEPGQHTIVPVSLK